MSITTPTEPRAARPARAAFDVQRVRADFPILGTKVHGKPLVYLDNAASTQKPRAVIDALRDYYERYNANVHRGVHMLSELATRAYEGTREKVRALLNAPSTREILFVRGTTEAINLVASSFGRQFVKEGDEILITQMEHHSNIVPWQMLCQERGAKLRVAPIDDRGELILDDFEKLLTPRTRLVSVVHVSNTLGTVNPVRTIVEMAHRRGIPVLLDGAQAAPHMPIDVQELDCDFYALSGHKIYGPTGIGVLYGKAHWLEQMPPYMGGGDMIHSVSFEKTVYNDLPYKFEAGTPNVAGTIGLGVAIDYVQGLGLDAIAAHESDLLAYGVEQLTRIPGLRLIGEARERAGSLSFLIEGAHPHDIGTILDHEGIAIRTGHHCTQPLMDRFGIPATSRAALAFYNTREEIDALVRGIHKLKRLFGV
jgi:cysteine desulfurase/selenocysteine lyase